MQQWLQVIIPLIGVITAIISASISYYFTKKNQSNIEERKLKESHYTEFIKAMSDYVVKRTPETRDLLATNQNRLLLIGSPKVVIALMEFHNYIKPETTKNGNFNNDEHDKLLTNLIKELRVDLYKNRKINDNYPIIHLTGKP